MNPVQRRKDIRLKWFDYTAEGAYFVTLVTHSRECLFGEIINDEMMVSEYGKVVAEEWERSASIRNEIELGASVVMPNHFHGIVHIFENRNENHNAVGAYGHTNGGRRGDRPDDLSFVGAYGHTPQHETKFRSPSHNLGAMIRGFKSAVTTRINALRGTPGAPVWQRNYYDHIIRTERAYTAIEAYILENPLRWACDEENATG